MVGERSNDLPTLRLSTSTSTRITVTVTGSKY